MNTKVVFENENQQIQKTKIIKEIFKNIDTHGFVSIDKNSMNYDMIKEYICSKNTINSHSRIANVSINAGVPMVNNTCQYSFFDKLNVWWQDKGLSSEKTDRNSEFLSCVYMDDSSPENNYAGFIQTNKVLVNIPKWIKLFFSSIAYKRILRKYHLDEKLTKKIVIKALKNSYMNNPKTTESFFYLGWVWLSEYPISLFKAWNEIYQYMLRYCASNVEQTLCQCGPGKIIIWDNRKVFYRILNGIKPNTKYTHIIGLGA